MNEEDPEGKIDKLNISHTWNDMGIFSFTHPTYQELFDKIDELVDVCNELRLRIHSLEHPHEFRGKNG